MTAIPPDIEGSHRAKARNTPSDAGSTAVPGPVRSRSGTVFAGARTGGTAVPGWAISCWGSGVEGGRAVFVVSRNPRSETDARLVARFGAKRTVAHGLGRYVRRSNSGALLSEGCSNRKQI